MVATTDTRGNLGPAEVLVQSNPGTNWLHDRWQAASDMGGTAIPGHHWVEIDLGRTVTAQEAVLDWEAAYRCVEREEGRERESEGDGV